ncbi:hypothetical protein FLAG1_09787 [Fusarium langsethiae]|uniref:Uncharacterized protein n=1 Tax=Fusarium langsethiae TaxID=179993 RepID=A0A0M9EQ92_FUSLA|nr:hypothetical protein FLAG1_09787 [Fusarium langsethiae]
MDKTPKPTKKERDREKDQSTINTKKGKTHIDYIDLSSSPAASSSMAPSRRANTPKTPSRELPNKPGEPSIALEETRKMSSNTIKSRPWDPFTYNSQPLPMFSSDNPVDPPRAGANASFSLMSGGQSRTSDTERSSYSNNVKVKTLETCLSLKDQYLAIPPNSHADQEPFWSRLLEKLERTSLTKGKFKEWKELNRAVESWAQARRSYMRENRLPAVSQSHPELDTLIDQWNLVFAQRFCHIHSGYFGNTIWSQFAEAKLKEVVKAEIDKWIANSLNERRDELQRHIRPTLLSSNSSLKDYYNAVKAMQNQYEAVQRDESQALESEVVMSMVLKLQPRLSAAILQRLNGPTEPTRRTEPVAASREPFSFNMPSTPASSSASTPRQKNKENGSMKNHPGPPVSSPASFNNSTTGVKGEHEKSGGHASKRRKDLDFPNRITTSSSNSKTEVDQAKRPRLDSRSGDSSFPADSRIGDTHDPRSLPFRRPAIPTQAGTRYGTIQNEARGLERNHKPPPSPAEPLTPPWRRNEPPGYRNPGGPPHPPPRYRDQYREGRRYQEVDSYRPPPRAIRESTAEFEGMTIQQQNMSLLRQIKRVQEIVDKKN